MEIIRQDQVSGQNRAIIQTRSAITGLSRQFEVRWKQHRPVGCDKCDEHCFRVFDNSTPPVLDYDTRSDGGLAPAWQQCAKCGQHETAVVSIETIR